VAITIDFEKFNKVGLKPILKKFEKEGLMVGEVEATDKAKRESGFLVKQALINFESGQKLLVKAKAGGGIFQVKLNNKVLAIKNVDDLDKAVREIIDYVNDNEKNYLKQKEKQLAQIKVKVPKIKAVNTSVAEQITRLQSSLAEISAANEAVRAQVVEAETVNTQKSDAVEALNREYQNLVAVGNALQTEYDQLKEAA